MFHFCVKDGDRIRVEGGLSKSTLDLLYEFYTMDFITYNSQLLMALALPPEETGLQMYAFPVRVDAGYQK